jgi:Cu-processing system ATP-binding protein
VASDRLAALRGRVGLPVRIRVTARPETVDHVAADLGGTRVNGVAVELLCQPEEKMMLLARVTGLGAAVEDLEISPPTLEEIYRQLGGERPQ